VKPPPPLDDTSALAEINFLSGPLGLFLELVIDRKCRYVVGPFATKEERQFHRDRIVEYACTQGGQMLPLYEQ
jgi:hypothetical protein